MSYYYFFYLNDLAIDLNYLKQNLQSFFLNLIFYVLQNSNLLILLIIFLQNYNFSKN